MLHSDQRGSLRAEDEVSSFLDFLGVTESADRRKFFGLIGKSMLALGAASGIPAVLSACSSSAGASGAGSKYRVAFLIFINNPYWQETADQVNKLLRPRLAKQGVSVDLVNGAASANAVDMSNAINTAVTQGYNGIIVAGIAPSMAPAIKQATDKGIPVFTFCCDVPGSTRVAFYGPIDAKIGGDAARLMATGLKQENILAKRNLSHGVIGIQTALGFTSLVNRANGFSDEWKRIGPKNVTLLPYMNVQDDAKLVYSMARDAIGANPNLVGIYVSTGSQYALGDAIIDAGKVGQVVGIAHEVFQPTLQVMLKGGLWAVTNDAPIGQVIPPGDDMARLLRTGKKPAHVINDSTQYVKKYWIYSSDTSWIDMELQHWNELFNGCKNGCPSLVASEMKGL